MDTIKSHFNIKKASFFGISAGLLLSCMLLLIKIAAPSTTTNMILFFRFTISFIYILIILLFKNLRNKSLLLKTKHFYSHLIRAALSVSGMLCLYFSLRFIPLIDANLLVMTNPLFIPILGFIFLNKKTNKKHWIAIIIGFIGIIFILKPGLEIFNPKALFALASGVTSAGALMFVRKLSRIDNQYVCLFYFFLLTAIISTFLALLNWETPNFNTFILLILVGILSSFYQHCLIKASSYASSKILSSLLYSSLVFSIIFSWIFFRERPDMFSWIGICLVVLCGFLTIKYSKK